MSSIVHLSPSPERRQQLLELLERRTELPLLALAFVMVPLLLGPYLWDIPDDEQVVVGALEGFIWALFATDLLVKTWVAPDRVAYLRRNWLDVLIVVVPFLRPLRVLRLVIFGSRAFRGARRLVNVDFLLVYGLGLVVIAATIVTALEQETNPAIETFADSLWWAMATVTTVGYGDVVPITLAGQAVTYMLMLGGIAFFSGVTANLAAFFTRADQSKDRDEALIRLAEEVNALRQAVGQPPSQPG